MIYLMIGVIETVLLRLIAFLVESPAFLRPGVQSLLVLVSLKSACHAALFFTGSPVPIRGRL